MKPQKLSTFDQTDGSVRVEATFAAEDVKRIFQMARRILAFSHQIDSTSDQDLPELLVEKLGAEQLERQYEEGIPSLLAPWVIDALAFQVASDPLLVDAPAPVYGAPYSFTLEVVPKPCFELSNYEPVTLQEHRSAPSDEDLEGYLLEIALDFAPFSVVEDDRPVQAGDRITVDITTFRGMKPVLQLTSRNRDFFIGEGWFSKGFDENVIGLRVGERKTFDFQALVEESKDASDTQTLTTTVTVRRICTQTVPDLSDEWVRANIPGVGDLAEFRQKVAEKVSLENAQRDEQLLLAPVAQALAQRLLNASISDAVLQQAANDAIARVDRVAQGEGFELAEYLESKGEGLDEFGERIMEEARSAVLQGYALDAYFRHFNMELTDADFDDAALLMAGGNAHAASSLRHQYELGGRSYILREQAQRLKANKEAVRAALAMGH